MTFGAQALDHVPCAVQIHVRRSGERRLFPEVDKGLASVGKLDGHEPAAAQIARGGIDHGERVADGYCGVDCIAAALQNADTHLGGELVGGDDHAVFGSHGCLRHCKRGAAYDGRKREETAERHGAA